MSISLKSDCNVTCGSSIISSIKLSLIVLFPKSYNKMEVNTKKQIQFKLLIQVYNWNFLIILASKMDDTKHPSQVNDWEIWNLCQDKTSGVKK